MLSFQQENAFSVYINLSNTSSPVVVNEWDVRLKYVSVHLRVPGDRIGARNLKYVAELSEKKILIGALSPGGGRPFLNKRSELHGDKDTTR